MKRIQGFFIKFVDIKGNILYKHNDFNIKNNKLISMNTKLYEDETK